MRSWLRFNGFPASALASALLLFGCASASVDRGAAQAQAGSPEATEVEIKRIPYDPQYPIYIVSVVPLSYGASGVTSGSGAPTAPMAQGALSTLLGGATGGSLEGRPLRGQSEPSSPVGMGMAAQLLTALSNSGNIRIIEHEALTRSEDGSYSCKLDPGGLGPFIVKGTVTEFSETADLSEQKRSTSLGGLGSAVGLLGAATGSSAAGLAGVGAAVADPKMEKSEMKRQGMVGMDLRVIDGGNSRIVGAFRAAGTFTTVSATSGASVFGIGGGSADFAASALGQATRAAMNDAIGEITTVLKTRVRGQVGQ